MNIIEIKDLHFGYGRSKAIYSGINLTLSAGSIYGLLGENGVGKTTLLRLICGLLFPTSGSCQTFGNESKKRMPNMLEKIYYLPEAFDIPAIKVAEYERNYSRLYPNFNHGKFEEYLYAFSIDKNKKMKNFSHGQQKKAMIAFALACKTPLLLMDEPTNGLDIPSKSIFRQIISDAIDANTTFVISTHQVRDLENVIDPIIILEVNQVLLNTPVAEITDKLKFVLAATPSPGALHSEQTLGGFLSVEPNNDGAESNVNVEVLFNTAIKNKEFFKSTFMNN